MIHKTFLPVVCLIAAGLIWLTASESQAGFVTKLNSEVFADSSTNFVVDDDWERVITHDGSGRTVLEVGDILEAIVRFSAFNSSLLSDLYGADYELTAYSRIKIKTISDNGDGTGDFVFESGFADGKSMLKLYEEDPKTASTRFDATTTVADGVDRATTETGDGFLVTSFGLDHADDFWIADDSLLDIASFALLDDNAQGGDFFFGLSVLSNPGDLLIMEDFMTTGASGSDTDHAMIGQGTLKKASANALAAGWQVGSDANFQFAVPEPSSALVWGCFTAFFAFSSRLRRRTRIS